MTIDELIELPGEELEKLSELELTAILQPYLEFTRPVYEKKERTTKKKVDRKAQQDKIEAMQRKLKMMGLE